MSSWPAHNTNLNSKNVKLFFLPANTIFLFNHVTKESFVLLQHIARKESFLWMQPVNFNFKFDSKANDLAKTRHSSHLTNEAWSKMRDVAVGTIVDTQVLSKLDKGGR